jgi:cytochrome c553
VKLLTIWVFLLGINTFANAQNVYVEALKLTPNLKTGKQVYRLCASCHLENGLGKKNGSFPVIAAQYRTIVIKQLKDIQSKHRQNPTMFPFSDVKTIGGVQAIADVAAYIESLPIKSNNGIGSGVDLKLGRDLYRQKCIACHKINALGNQRLGIPRLRNQHYAYLLRQLQWMQNGYRKNADLTMLALIKNMSKRDLSALADYISRR